MNSDFTLAIHSLTFLALEYGTACQLVRPSLKVLASIRYVYEKC